MLEANGRINLLLRPIRPSANRGQQRRRRRSAMIDILNLALPYFGLIFIGFACGRAKGLPETGLAWMNFFMLYVALPPPLFGCMSKTPLEELNTPPFLIATSPGTISAFVLAMTAGRII